MHTRIGKNHVNVQLSDNDLMRLKETLDLIADQTPYYQGTILQTLRRIIQRYEELNTKEYEAINLGK